MIRQRDIDTMISIYGFATVKEVMAMNPIAIESLARVVHAPSCTRSIRWLQLHPAEAFEFVEARRPTSDLGSCTCDFSDRLSEAAVELITERDNELRERGAELEAMRTIYDAARTEASTLRALVARWQTEVAARNERIDALIQRLRYAAQEAAEVRILDVEVDS